MKFIADRHFIYITVQIDEHKKQLQSYYSMKKDDLEEITKEWSTDLLIPVDPAEISDINNLEAVQDTLIPSKRKKTDEVKDLRTPLVKTASMSPEQGGDGEEIDGT
jgi:hypothetical protein